MPRGGDESLCFEAGAIRCGGMDAGSEGGMAPAATRGGKERKGDVGFYVWDVGFGGWGLIEFGGGWREGGKLHT